MTATSSIPPRPATFLSSHGYHQVTERLALFHNIVGDLAGPNGLELISARLGANWRVRPQLRLNAGASHMSTYAVQIYVRDLLETEDPTPGAGRAGSEQPGSGQSWQPGRSRRHERQSLTPIEHHRSGPPSAARGALGCIADGDRSTRRGYPG